MDGRHEPEGARREERRDPVGLVPRRVEPRHARERPRSADEARKDTQVRREQPRAAVERVVEPRDGAAVDEHHDADHVHQVQLVV